MYLSKRRLPKNTWSSSQRIERRGFQRQAVLLAGCRTGHAVFHRDVSRDREIAAGPRAGVDLEVPARADLVGVTNVSVDRVQFPAGQPDVEALAVARLLGGQVEHAARRVGPVQRRAGTAHQLRACQVVEWKGDGRPLLRPEERQRRIAAVDQRDHPAVQRAVEASHVEVVVVDSTLSHLCPGGELEQFG